MKRIKPSDCVPAKEWGCDPFPSASGNFRGKGYYLDQANEYEYALVTDSEGGVVVVMLKPKKVKK